MSGFFCMKYITILFFIFHCCYVSISFAQDSDAYQRAYDQYDAGNYLSALTQFNALLENDSENSALLYNLGLCHHYLEQYEQADQYFSQLLDDEFYTDWATYQLAMNDWRQGMLGSAEIGLMQVVYNSNDVDLIELATLRYQELLQEWQPAGTTKEKTFWGNVSLAYAKDDNVVDPRFTTANDESDDVVELAISLAKQWNAADRKSAWQLQGYLLDSRYSSISDADLQLFGVGLEKRFYFDQAALSLGLGYETSKSGGDNYLNRTSFSFQLDSRGNDWQGFVVEYEFSDNQAQDNAFAQLTGDTHVLELQYHHPLSQHWRWQITGEVGDDDREPIREGIVETDFSAQRQTIGTGLIFDNQAWRWELSYQNRDSDYGQITRLISGASIDRSDDRTRWLSRLEYLAHRNFLVFAEWYDIDNQSNVPRFTYQQQYLSAGIIWQF